MFDEAVPYLTQLPHPVMNEKPGWAELLAQLPPPESEQRSGPQPGDHLLVTYLPDATVEEREQAREAFRKYGKALWGKSPKSLKSTRGMRKLHIPHTTPM